MAMAAASNEGHQWRLPTELPHLEGPRGRLVGIVFIALTTLVFLLAIGSTVFDGIDQLRNIPADVGYGFRTVTLEHSGNTVYSLSPAARTAGLRKDDRILAIDGQTVSAGASENEIGARMAGADHNAALVVQSGAAPLHQVNLHHVRGSIWTAANVLDGMPVWLSAAINLLTSVGVTWVLLAAALLLFARRRHDRGAMAFAFAFALTATNANAAFWLIPYAPAMLSYYVPHALSVSGFAMFIVAVAAFPDGRFRTPTTRTAPLLVLPLLLTRWALVAVHPSIYTPPEWALEIPKLMYPLADFGLLLCVGAQILRYLRDPLGTVERQQFKWVILGFAIAVIAIAIAQLIIQTDNADSADPVLNGTLDVALLVFALAPPLGLLVSLLRYRLYDAESAISRSVAYGALTLALLAIFAGSERIIELMGEQYLGHSIGLLAGGLGAGIAAVMIAPIHHRVSAWAERRFQKDLLQLRHGLPLVMADMRETASLDQLAEAVLKRTEKGVRAVHAAIVIDGDLLQARDVPAEAVTRWMASWIPADGDRLDCAKGDPLFPMRVQLAADGVGTIGWLLLGPRPDGSFYGKDEREAFAEIAAPVARAIAVARERSTWLRAQAAVTSSLAERLTSLENAFGQLIAGGRQSAAESR